MRVDDRIGDSETADARRWWGDRRLIRWYTEAQPWTGPLVDALLASSPSSVVELGCNAGRTLRAIRDRGLGVALTGVDINRRAVAWGRDHWSLDLRVGDERSLVPADVAFTVSVIDHIPEPQRALEALVVSAPVVILVEPWIGSEGRVTEGARSPYTYSWDYPARLRAMGMAVTQRRFPISDEGLGQHYRLYRATRRRG